MRRLRQTAAQRQKTRQRQRASRRHQQPQEAAEAARRRKRARNERALAMGTSRHSARRSSTGAGLSDCFLKCWILPYQRRDRSRVTAALVLRLRSIQQKSLALPLHCYYCVELLYVYPSEEALSCRPLRPASLTQMNSTWAPATSLPAENMLSTRFWWGQYLINQLQARKNYCAI